MSAPFELLVPLTDLRWFTDSPDVGDSACLCSWCGKVIERGVPIRMYRTISPGEVLEARFHDACCEPVFGVIVQSFDDVEWPADDGHSPADWPDLCYCHGDENGHDPAPDSIFHLNEQVLDRARQARGEEPEADVDLGACCACRKKGPTVRNIVMLPKRAPVAGTGWGCVTCRVPADGAIAVVCDACMEADRPILDVCFGYAPRNERVAMETVTDPFEHNPAMHADEAGFPFPGAQV